jgi:hypothetical protein
MKVKELIEVLSKVVDQDLDVCFFDGPQGPSCIDNIGVYYGLYEIDTVKMIRQMEVGRYVGIGWAGNYVYSIPPNFLENVY